MRNPARRGATPLELIVVVVVALLALSAAAPTARRTLDSIAVSGAARQIASAHLRARIAAVMESRTALLTVTADSVVIRVVAGSDTIVRWKSGGPGTNGVTVTGPARAMRFSPVGIMEGVTNGTWRLARGGARRNVIVSRLGRVRVVVP